MGIPCIVSVPENPQDQMRSISVFNGLQYLTKYMHSATG